MIAIVDYGMGNLRSVEKGFEKAGVTDVIVSPAPSDAAAARGIVLPGVGAFRDAIARLEQTGLADAIRDRAAAGVPVLGICLGMQLLATRSLEDGDWAGLDLVSGTCERLPSNVKVPHIGWNTVEYPNASPLFEGVPERTAFYFVHSFHLVPASESLIIGRTEYGVSFASAVASANVFGAQFHPEKSSELGLQMLANFGEMVKRVA